MSDRQIKITAEQMRAVARYETTVSEIADFKNNSEVDVIFEQPFQITLDDVLEAVKNIEANGYTLSTLGEKAKQFIANWESEKYRKSLAGK